MPVATVRVLIDGVALDLPDELTPVRNIEETLIRAWPKWRAARGLPWSGGEAGVFWFELLFALWNCRIIELAARSGEPDAVPKVMDFPPGERLWSRFFVGSLIPYGELRYDPTRRRFFDVCVRPLPPAAEPEQQAPPQATSVKRKPGRPAGQGSFATDDDKLVQKMRELIEGDSSVSPTAAADQFAGGAKGSGILASKIKRLVKRYRKKYPRS